MSGSTVSPRSGIIGSVLIISSIFCFLVFLTYTNFVSKKTLQFPLTTMACFFPESEKSSCKSWHSELQLFSLILLLYSYLFIIIQATPFCPHLLTAIYRKIYQSEILQNGSCFQDRGSRMQPAHTYLFMFQSLPLNFMPFLRSC